MFIEDFTLYVEHIEEGGQKKAVLRLYGEDYDGDEIWLMTNKVPDTKKLEGYARAVCRDFFIEPDTLEVIELNGRFEEDEDWDEELAVY